MKLLNISLIIFATSLVVCSCKHSEEAASATYRNPIINADVPDMTLCRVGDYYYMVSTTMHLMPGAPVMRSTDMQNWETISYLFDKIEDAPRYDLVDGTAYGQGQWAASMRYHNNRFYVWFTANGAPFKGFVFSAEKAEGPWELIARPPHLHDGSLFFDDDNRAYICCEQGHLIELSDDLQGIKECGVDTILFQRDEDEKTSLLEGSNMFKHEGKYYIMMISMDWSIPGRVRREVCYRADSLLGPYEKKVILETPFETYGGVGQGAIVDGKNGEWYGLIFQDRGGVGRVPCLMPCRWIDGWPILGDEDGKVPSDLSKAHINQKGVYGSDDFSGDKLSLLWQWNHNPVDSAWSLSENPGNLRLHTARVVENIFVAPNTITQRMAGPKCTGTAKINVANMKNGDRAGFSAYNGDSGVLTIEQNDGKYTLVLSEQKSIFDHSRNIVGDDISVFETIELSTDDIWLRIDGDFTPGNDWATFSYSLDGTNWNVFEKRIKMVFDYRRMFMGSKFAIFNYATKSLGGYVDVDDFEYNQYE